MTARALTKTKVLVASVLMFGFAASCAQQEAPVVSLAQPTSTITEDESTMTEDDQIARGIAQRLIARGRGTAQAAAYVRTTRALFVEADATAAELDTVRPSDVLLVVKVFGSFQPQHSVPFGSPAPASILMGVYNVRIRQVIETTFFNGDGADITGSALDLRAAKPEYADLRKMGTPRSIAVE